MNSLYDNDRNVHEYDVTPEADREISLGTSTILGIFFALALVCAVFFGFGYTMGRRSAQAAPPTAAPATTTASSSSKRSSAETTPDEPVATKTSPIVNEPEPQTQPQTPLPAGAPPSKPSATQTAAVPPPATKPLIAKPTMTTMPPPAAPTTAAGSMVQIAAVSHKEDADILIAALQRRGYDVSIHQEAQDKLLHVQIGPFATRKEADTMRQRLLADGYNAIVK